MHTSSTQKSYNPRFGVQTGDIWRVGNQYLVCGDAADPSVKETVSRLLPVEAILTSPPYPKVRKYQEIGDVPYYADLALARCEKEGLAIERIHRQ
jgi:hypothetical protein